MKCKCGVKGRGNGCSHVWTLVLLLEVICVVLVASEGQTVPADAVAEEFSHFPQYSFPHHRHNAPHFRRQLSPIEQKEILTDIQQNHRYQQPLVDPRSPTNSHQHPFSVQNQQQYQSTLYNQQQEHLIRQHPTQQSTVPRQSQLTTQQSSELFPQAQSPLTTQQSAILRSLQQSPLSSPQFSSLFSQQSHSPISTQNSLLPIEQPSSQLSLQNSPISNLESIVQPQSPRATQQSPVPTNQSPTLTQPPFTIQQSSIIYSQQPNSPLSTQQSLLPTQESTETQVKPRLTTQDPAEEEVTTDIKVLKGVSNTEFTIQRSISDPEELKRVQMLEVQREKERIERARKIQEEQLKLIREENERRRKEREEEDRRDEERRLKLQEQLRKIHEEKERRRKQQEEEELKAIQERQARLLKQQQEEQLRKLQDEERRKKEEGERLRIKEQKEREERLRIIEELKEQEENEKKLFAQTTESNTGISQEILGRLAQRTSPIPVLSAVPTSPQNIQRPRPRARVIEEPDSINVPEELFLQDERQKLYYQLKEAQQVQQKQNSNDEKQQTQESQQISLNNRGPPNQIAQNKDEQQRTQPSKLEKQLHQKQLQEQLQKQFQLQLLQRQDLLRQLKLAVANAATPTNEDQIVPGPVAISGGNNSAQLFLANGQKIQVVQSSRQGRPLADIIPRNVPLSTSSVSTTTQRPPRALFEELTKGVLPPGADFEVIRHKQDGGLEDVGKQIPQNLPQKKVTFVFLEEQTDGSFKVKGVRGNNNGEPGGEEEQTPAADVDSIIKKIQEGDLKLPVQQPKSPPAPQSTQQYPTSLSPATPTQSHIPPSTVNAFQPTVKPKNIIKTVSSSFNFQPQQTTIQPVGNVKTVSSINFQTHPEMEFLPSVTLPPRYEIGSTLNSSPSTKPQPQTVPTESPTTYLNSPYSVEVHPDSKNSGSPLYSRDVPSRSQINVASSNPYTKKDQEQITSTKSEQSIPNYQQTITPVTPYPTISQFTPTPNSVTTVFQPNKYSPSQIQYTTPAPKKISQEPFLPTDPSFVGPSQSYSPFSGSKSNKKQIPQKEDPPIPGIIYANPSQVPTVTTHAGVSGQEETVLPDYRHKQRDFQQNIEAPSLKSPTRVAPPPPENILKESERILPLDEDGSIEYQSNGQGTSSLAEVLKKEGLYAMARFIRESGLNNILNDTGPYTVFAPTDKAFRALLVQLGGPEKAEEKFRENPRLLSGLLLHHVIPGAFELSSLQDEMTGVSLAGTQLRVNTYTTQDVEWNEVQVVTINGARISRDKHDIPIPQGVAHAVDRVMFPLPVGNILQTLRSDRERRFNKFLRAVQAAGLADTFSGHKMYTVFAPTDRAFSVVDSEDLEELLTDREMSRALVLRHSSPGTLYSAGMRFYQLRDSMEKGSTITLHKTNGQVKANSANVVTQNIPATNGVIHAIDGLL